MSKELKNRISCYVRVDHDLVNFSSCDIDNFKDYRVFLISGKFGQSDFQRIYHTTSKKNIELLIDGETISTVARRRKFLKIFPDRHFIFLHLQEQKESMKPFFDPLDVHLDTEFFCEIGEVFAKMGVMIEPAPQGDPNYGHFHVVTLCPKLRSVEPPEPYRCSITELPCRFESPMSKPLADKLDRQKEYGLRILQYGAYFEYYATIKLKERFKIKGLKLDLEKLPNLNLNQKIRLLYSLNMIDKKTFSKFMDVKKERNKLAHEAKPFHVLYDLEDKKAMEIIRKAEECLESLRSKN